jgi:hypothetical protein
MINGFSNRSTDPIWISFTGTAVVDGIASYLLPAGSSIVAGGYFTLYSPARAEQLVIL